MFGGFFWFCRDKSRLGAGTTEVRDQPVITCEKSNSSLKGSTSVNRVNCQENLLTC